MLQKMKQTYSSSVPKIHDIDHGPMFALILHPGVRRETGAGICVAESISIRIFWKNHCIWYLSLTNITQTQDDPFFFGIPPAKNRFEIWRRKPKTEVKRNHCFDVYPFSILKGIFFSYSWGITCILSPFSHALRSAHLPALLRRQRVQSGVCVAPTPSALLRGMGNCLWWLWFLGFPRSDTFTYIVPIQLCKINLSESLPGKSLFPESVADYNPSWNSLNTRCVLIDGFGGSGWCCRCSCGSCEWYPMAFHQC